MTDEEFQSKAERAKNQKRSFDEFMSGPATQLLMSMVPPSQPPELLITLIRSAFEAGVNAGVSGCAIDLFRAYTKLKPPKD